VVLPGSGGASSPSPLPLSTGFICLEKQYNLSVYIQQHLCSYIEDLVADGALFFMQHGTNRNTPSLTNPIEASAAHLITCMHVFQQVLSSNGFSASTTGPLQQKQHARQGHANGHGHGHGEHALAGSETTPGPLFDVACSVRCALCNVQCAMCVVQCGMTGGVCHELTSLLSPFFTLLLLFLQVTPVGT